MAGANSVWLSKQLQQALQKAFHGFECELLQGAAARAQEKTDELSLQVSTCHSCEMCCAFSVPHARGHWQTVIFQWYH